MLPCYRGLPRVLIFSSDPFLGLGVAVIAIIVACGAFLLLVLILLFVAFRTGRWWAASLSATWASLTTNNYYLCRGLQEHLGRLFFFVAPNLRLTLKWLASLILLASSVSSNQAQLLFDQQLILILTTGASSSRRSSSTSRKSPTELSRSFAFPFSCHIDQNNSHENLSTQKRFSITMRVS